jgi:ParB/RepB/Spo0J family partition protein
MAVQFKAEHERTSEYRFFPKDLTIRAELNGRHDKPDVEELIKDILEHGQHTPVPIRNEGGEAVLVAGFSRWRAISEINKRKLTEKPLQLRCTYVRCDEREAFLMNISENRFRNDVTAIDDAHNMQRLLNVYQMTEEEIAKQYFPTAKTTPEIAKALKWVKDRIALIGLTPEAVKAVRDGRVKETAAVAISKLTAAQQKEAVKGDGPVKGKDVAAVKGPKPAKVTPMDPELRRRITAVCDSAEWDNYNEAESTHIEVNAVLLAALRNYTEEAK